MSDIWHVGVIAVISVWMCVLGFDVDVVMKCYGVMSFRCFFFQAEDGIRDLVRSRGLGDVYKRQNISWWIYKNS